MISSVDFAFYGVSRAKEWVSVDCGTIHLITITQSKFAIPTKCPSCMCCPTLNICRVTQAGTICIYPDISVSKTGLLELLNSQSKLSAFLYGFFPKQFSIRFGLKF